VRTEHRDFTTPLGTTSRGRLEFARGASRVTIQGDHEMPLLARAYFDGVVPMVFAEDGKVTFEYPLVSPSEWLRPNRRGATVALNATIPWDLVFSGGVSMLRAELDGLHLGSFEIRSGASDVELGLPRPRGVVRLRIGGGASKVAFRRPAGVPMVVSVGGGVSRLAFDAERYGSMGGTIRLATPGADAAEDRYEIEIGGGASELTVREGAPRAR
jgi:hypothetical protein